MYSSYVAASYVAAQESFESTGLVKTMLPYFQVGQTSLKSLISYQLELDDPSSVHKQQSSCTDLKSYLQNWNCFDSSDE